MEHIVYLYLILFLIYFNIILILAELKKMIMTVQILNAPLSRIIIVIISIFISACSATKPSVNYHYSIQKEINVSRAAVVSAHSLASIAGLEMLKKGGNAVDAAIATQLALAVVYPAAGNLGGGGFMVARLKDGTNIAIDYREKAPGKAERDMFLDAEGNPIVRLSLDGHLASGVPGTVAGLFASHKYAKLPMSTLIAPAIDYAENGFAISAAEANNLNAIKDDLLKLNTAPNAFVKDSQWVAGDSLIQKDLAATLKRIATLGQKGFYEGETAQLIVSEMERGNGIISLDDLKTYHTSDREVVDFEYKDFRILTMPLSSSGGIILQQMMKMIEDKDIRSMGFHSPEATQLMIEVERRAFADRATYLGDPDFVHVPLKTLVSDDYLKMRMEDFNPGVAGNSDTILAGYIPESEETTHLSVVDDEGNAVSVTTTLNGGYGSKVVIGGAGFFMNNEMDDFSVKAGAPNMFGALGNEKNEIVPGKRMLSSMTPTIVLQNDKPFLVLGTPGGTTILTSVFQTLVNILEFNLSVSDAVNKPKFHHQWYPDEVLIEKGFDAHTADRLREMGYLLKNRNKIGRTEVIRIDYPAGKRKPQITAVADGRGDDDARGF